MSELTSEYIMAVNVDGIGLRGNSTSISFYECPQELENRIMECVKEVNDIERTEPWPMGDHMIFATVGVPAIAMTACNIFSILETVIHTPDDNMKNIDLDILDNIVSFMLSCIQ